ncbi:acyltransferase family protein [Duganella callida]|uniref:Acyltransferase n=1 Tax=Duganella callida TaxID=2561932 RepID=A0A4Y9SAS9_9BURK|nr:acyltransferase [Duganella callida]TFW17279.1 acyltransferase [Duganella callida]
MNRAFSIYLDLLRFLAACLVVIYHSNSRLLSASVLPLSTYGHEAVIVFFVLSGYVIAYATDARENSPASYWASRLSRIWSLAIPAILLTPLLDMAGEALAPAVYEGYTTHDHAALRMATSALFLNEVWTVSIMCFSNIAYWSLNYEVSYYLLFALYAFGGRRRWLWMALAGALIGPKILLLAPVWVLGVAAYRWRAPQRMPEWLGWTCVAASLLLFAAIEASRLSELLSAQVRAALGAHWYRELNYSRWFLSDYLLGLSVFLHFIGVRRVADRLAPALLALERPVRALAAYTFSLYILHQPLLYFYTALIGLPPSDARKYVAVIGCVALTVWLIGSQTEQKRHRLRAWLERALQRPAMRYRSSLS